MTAAAAALAGSDLTNSPPSASRTSSPISATGATIRKRRTRRSVSASRPSARDRRTVTTRRSFPYSRRSPNGSPAIGMMPFPASRWTRRPAARCRVPGLQCRQHQQGQLVASGHRARAREGAERERRVRAQIRGLRRLEHTARVGYQAFEVAAHQRGGTRPKNEIAEYRPPMWGGLRTPRGTLPPSRAYRGPYRVRDGHDVRTPPADAGIQQPLAEVGRENVRLDRRSRLARQHVQRTAGSVVMVRR